MGGTKATARRIAKHIENLNSVDPEVTKVYLIRYYGAKAFDPLKEACSHPNPQVRLHAVYALAHTKDPHERVRYDAAVTLGFLGDLRSIPHLIDLMNTSDEENSVDSAAGLGIRALGMASVPTLLENLKKGTSVGHYIAPTAWDMSAAKRR